jgi:hypothetical protein
VFFFSFEFRSSTEKLSKMLLFQAQIMICSWKKNIFQIKNIFDFKKRKFLASLRYWTWICSFFVFLFLECRETSSTNKHCFFRLNWFCPLEQDTFISLRYFHRILKTKHPNRFSAKTVKQIYKSMNVKVNHHKIIAEKYIFLWQFPHLIQNLLLY